MRTIRGLLEAVLCSVVIGGLACCSGGGGNGSPSVTPPSALSYPSPSLVNAGTAVSGLTPSVQGTVSSYSVSPALPAGLSLDPASGAISGTPTMGMPQATYTITAANGGGSTSFPLLLAVAEGPVGVEVKDVGGTQLPPLQLSNQAPASGEMQTVSINAAGASVIALSVSGSGCGALAAQTVQGPSLSQTAAVANTGTCVLQADVTTAGGTVTQTGQFSVVPTQLPAVASALSFKGGSYFASGDPSLLPPSSVLTIQSASAPQNFINGGSGSVFITPSDASVVSQAVVAASGIPGYFAVPVTPDNGRLRIDLSVAQNFFQAMRQSGARIAMAPRARRVAPASAKPGIGNRQAAAATATVTETLSLQLMDTGGALSPVYALPLNFQEVGSGPIQVSLSWHQPEDLDLHLVTPSSEEIYYGHRSDATGGSLDLDSNAACSIDNIDNENIVWPSTSSPAAGQYIVRVDYFANCGGKTAVPFTIRVTNCGTTTEFSGSFNPGDADAGSAGAGRTVTTFNYTPCSGLSVQGKATYDDYVATLAGQATQPRPLPIRHAVVEVHKQSDDSLLEVGDTDEAGNYSIPFSMTTPGPYYTEVVAEQNDEILREGVFNNRGVLYSVKSDPQDASMKPNATNVDIKVTRDKFSGAFNIFNVGLNASRFSRAQSQKELPQLRWQWTPGVATCGGTASCYQNGIIYVLNTAADTDEFDDPVLAHEFGHFFIEQMSRASSAHGHHSSDTRVAAGLAWNEGVATFFGQSVLNSPLYIDTSAGTATVRDVETPENDVPIGTSDDTLSGDVSEAVVRAVLWDLADSAQDSRTLEHNVVIKDVIAKPQAVFSTLFSLRTTTHDRGVAGVDLVDFLDQWLCSNFSTWDAMPGNNFNGLVTQLNRFPYTPPPAPANCN